MRYDLVVIGSGPGGYVAALRGAQLGMKVAIVERENLGGVCLNWGCIPTKALLQSAHVFRTAQDAAAYGVQSGQVMVDVPRVVARSREVAATMSKGVSYLLNKAGVTVVAGEGSLRDAHTVLVKDAEGVLSSLEAKSIIIATGARVRELPFLPIDGKKVIGYRQALLLEELPKSMAVIGSGAIGSELGEYFHCLGVELTIIEALPNLLPLEDEEVSKAVARAFRKQKIKTLVGASVKRVDTTGEGCVVEVESKKGPEQLHVDMVLSAVGIAPNVEGLGLEALGIALERGRIKVDAHYATNVAGVYAIGDVIPTVALAHVASAEAIHCVEHIAGRAVEPLDYGIIPGCYYITPEVASAGLREHQAQEQGIEYIVGKFPFTASGKATAMGARDGFVKLLFRKDNHQLIGAHVVGAQATEQISELALALKHKLTAEDIHATVHPHPTLSEAAMEAAAAALGCSVNM